MGNDFLSSDIISAYIEYLSVKTFIIDAKIVNHLTSYEDVTKRWETYKWILILYLHVLVRIYVKVQYKNG